MAEAPRKIELLNLPAGTMKSDITDVLRGWVASTHVLSLEFKRNLKGETTSVIVLLSSTEDCNNLVEYFEKNFTEGVFAFPDNFGNYKMVQLRRFMIGTVHNKEQKEVWTFSDDEDLPHKDLERGKIMIQQVPLKTERSEIEEILKQWKPYIKIFRIDLAHPKISTCKLNAYITLSEERCNDIVNYFHQTYPLGYEFVNKEGESNVLLVRHYIGKYKAKVASKPIVNNRLHLHGVPRNTSKQEIKEILHNWRLEIQLEKAVIHSSKRYNFSIEFDSSQDCEAVYNHYKIEYEPHGGYAFQNEQGGYGKVKMKIHSSNSVSTNNKLSFLAEKRDETGFMDCKDTYSAMKCPIEEPVIANNNVCESIEQSTKRKEMSTSSHDLSSTKPSQSFCISSKQMVEEDKVPLGPSSPMSTSSDSFLSEPLTQISDIMKEKKDFKRSINQTSSFVYTLEETLKEKCPDLFVSETELHNLKISIDDLRSKIEDFNKKNIDAQSEYENLKEQIKVLNEN
jgi:hypothetical protein